MGKRIVVLGGGTGGLVAANELRKHLPSEHQVILVEKNGQHASAPSFLWLMIGERKPEQITRPVHQLVRPGVEIIQAEVRNIDVDNHRVEADSRTFAYDYLVVALGAKLAPEIVPGLSNNAHTFYTFDGVVKLRDALEKFSGGTIAVVVGAVPYKCPGAPHESVMLLDYFFRKRGIRDKVEIHLFTPEPQPMPVAGPTLGSAVRKMLEGGGIAFHPLHKLSAVDPQTKKITFDGKESVRYDLAAVIPPHRSPNIVREAGLTNEAGWVPVDRATLETRFENVYAVGDVTTISIPGRWKPDVPLMLPKAGVFAHAQAQVVARRIVAKIDGRDPKDMFNGDGY